MTAPAPQRPVILRRVQLSTDAWTLLQHSTASTLASAGVALDASERGVAGIAPDFAAAVLPQGEAAAAAWAELQHLDMSPLPGEIKRQWSGAVALLLTAPITVTARATYNGVSTTSVLGLRGGRGLAAHQRHVTEQRGAQTVITGTENSVEITLFDEENIWGALSRLLPPLDVVQAPARSGSPEAAVVIPVGTEQAALVEPAAGLVGREEANVTLNVITSPPGKPQRIWSAMWSVADGKLHSVTTRSADAPELRLTEVPAGSIGHELIFAVVGAHDALTAANPRAEAEQ